MQEGDWEAQQQPTHTHLSLGLVSRYVFVSQYKRRRPTQNHTQPFSTHSIQKKSLRLIQVWEQAGRAAAVDTANQ